MNPEKVIVLETLRARLGPDEWRQFGESWEFLKAKTARLDKTLLRALPRGEEAFCRAFLKADSTITYSHIALKALEGEWDLVNREVYYKAARSPACVPGYAYYTSREKYEEFRKRMLALAEEKAKETHKNWEYFYGNEYELLMRCNELDRVIREGVPILYDNPETMGSRGIFGEDEDDPASDKKAFRAALWMLALNLLPRARRYIDLLQKYRAMPYPGPGSGAWRAHCYDAMTDFLEYLWNAKSARDPEEAKTWASRAVTANFRAVARNYNTDAASLFRCSSPWLALCAAVEFELDAEWARQCCRAMLHHLLEDGDYPPVFFKAVEWGAWMPAAKERGYLPAERAGEIFEEILAARFQGKR